MRLLFRNELAGYRNRKNILQEFKNNTEWQYSEPFFNAPRCNEIVAAAGLLGTGNSLTREDIRVCLDLEFTVSLRH